jgi:cation:H+ antiporter
VGGRVIVMFAVELAREFGLAERVIALTIVSAGTSLPELATSIVAARKKNFDIAVGNIVGSNIFNIFFVLGISAVVAPIPLQSGSNFDLMVNLTGGLLLFVFLFTGKGRRLERWEGALFMLLYLIYLGTLIL